MGVRNPPLVIVSHQLPTAWLEKLKGYGRLIVGPDPALGGGLAKELASSLPEAEGLFTLLTVLVGEELLAKAPRLRVVSNMAVGVDNIDLKACSQRGIPVGHTPGVLTEGTADLTMALLLSVARLLPQAALDAREGRWTTWLPTGWLGADLDGATLGIIGLGKIGSAVAHRAAAFGVKLVYSNPFRRADIESRYGALRLDLDQLLKESDFVTVHVPLTSETRGLMNQDQLKLMKDTAILINTSRGPVVDQEALYRALTEGWIAAAGLDVTDPEPLAPNHPLYSLDNCLILPHIGSATRNNRRRMAELACDNLIAGLEGRPLPHCANLDVVEQRKGNNPD